MISLLMNHIGTHDTERALTVLAGEPVRGHGRKWQSSTHLSGERRERGLKLMRLAALMQFTLPGVPCIYYGDEAGMEGYKDPFNRSCYPWGQEDQALLSWYRRLAKFREMMSDVMREGDFSPVMAGNHCMAYTRTGGKQSVFVAVNASGEERSLWISDEWKDGKTVFGAAYSPELKLPGYGCAVWIRDFSEETHEAVETQKGGGEH